MREKEALIGLFKATGPSQPGASPRTMPTPDSVLVRGPNSVPPAAEESAHLCVVSAPCWPYLGLHRSRKG